MKNKKLVVEKPWEKFEQFTHNEISTVKILTVNPDSKLSLQLHHKREEFWRIVKGSCRVQIGDKVFNAKIGDEFEIPKETAHRLMGTKNLAQVLEISYGDFDEEDIKRIEDDYNRVN
jgi:mannose-6-phosphate isomerase-like protein (cupin superfamily)